MTVGDRLRDARKRRRLSLRALAKVTSFSASFLSQVELGQSMPSLGSLQRIADALGVTVAALLDRGESPSPVQRRVGRASLRSEWSKATVESLIPPATDERLQAMLVRLDAGGRTGATGYSRGRRLFMYCLSGTVVVIASDPNEQLTLKAGDSLVIEGPRTTWWENRTKRRAELIAVTALLT